MAHKKGAGSSNNGRESHSKRLGIKIFGGQLAIAGNIIVRQRGTNHHPDKNVGIGKDHTLFALTDGQVVFRKKHNNKSYVSVLPLGEPVTETVEKPVAQKAEPSAAPAAEVQETPAAEKEAPKKAAEAPETAVADTGAQAASAE